MKENKTKNTVKNSFGTDMFKRGSYSMVLIIIVLAIAVVINILVSNLPSKYTKIDLSKTLIYDISDTTKNIVKNIDKDIDITVLGEESAVDERIKKFLSEYESLSDRIKVTYVDTILHPQEASGYGDENNQIIVKCEQTGKTENIAFSKIIIQKFDQQAYSMGMYRQIESEWDGEGQLTGAINYVTSENSNKMYALTGHKETSFPLLATERLNKANIEVCELSLMKEPIPDDCKVIVEYAPQTDLADDEKDSILEFLKRGGRLIYMPSYIPELSKDTLKNWNSILTAYNIEMGNKLVADYESAYRGNPLCFMPVALSTDIMKSYSLNEPFLLINAYPLSVSEEKSEVTATPILSSSARSSLYSDSDDKLDSEVKTYYIGYAVSKETEKTSGNEDKKDAALTAGDKEDATLSVKYNESATLSSEEKSADDEGSSQMTKVVILPSTIISDEITKSFSNISNLSLFCDAASWMYDGADSISIDKKSIEVKSNLISNPGLTGLIFIAVIPVVSIVAGFVVWNSRRRR